MAQVKIYTTKEKDVRATRQKPISTMQANAIPIQGDTGKVVVAPRRSMTWNEAASWVVKEHAGAWKRLADR